MLKILHLYFHFKSAFH